MSTDVLIRAAMDAGVALTFEGGKLKACGHVDVLRAWAPRLRQHKSALIEALQPRAPSFDWREADRVYQLHHIGCATCVAAGRGYGLRCGTGTALWAAYCAATEPKESK